MTHDETRRDTTYRLSRRAFLGASTTATVALAGCLGDSGDDGATPTPESDTGTAPSLPRVENPPDAVYLPSHRNAMKMLSPVDAGEYTVSPMITYPHRFWLVTGTQREEVTADTKGIHLMATIQDAESGAVLPIDKGAQARVKQDGELVDQRAPWPMISQRMGFHFGDNVGLPGTGTYTVEFDVNPLTDVRKTRAFEGRFESRETVTFEFSFDTETQQELVDGVEYFDESEWGKREALPPMGMGDGGMSGGDDGMEGMSMPYSQVPEASAYPGTAVGTPSTGDATFVVHYLDESDLGDGGGYLLVSPRTPYNRVPLPDMALSVSGAVEGELTQTLDSELGHHYGLTADLAGGDELEITIETPPQVARHRGYETAFLDMPPVGVTIPE